MVLIQKLGSALEVPTPGAIRRGLGRLTNTLADVSFIHSEEEIWYFIELCQGSLQAWPRDVPNHLLSVQLTPVLDPSLPEMSHDGGFSTLAKLLFHGGEFRAVQNGGQEPQVVDEEINALSEHGEVYCQVNLDAQVDLGVGQRPGDGHPEWVDDFFAHGWKVSPTFKHGCMYCDQDIFFHADRWIVPMVDRSGRPDLQHGVICQGGEADEHWPDPLVLVPPDHVFRNASAVEAEYPDWMRNLANAVVTTRQITSETSFGFENRLHQTLYEHRFPAIGPSPETTGPFFGLQYWILSKPGNGEVQLFVNDGGFHVFQVFQTKKRATDPRAKSRRSKKRLPNVETDLPPDLRLRPFGSHGLQYPEGSTVNSEGANVVLSVPLLPAMNRAALVEWAESIPVEAHSTSEWTFRTDAGPYLNPTVVRGRR